MGTESKRSGFWKTAGSRMTANSQIHYADQDQTIIIFDWDDTLCPSSWMRKHAQFDAQGHLKAKLDNNTRHELQMLADQVNPLIELANQLGKVILVTNAKKPWVD